MWLVRAVDEVGAVTGFNREKINRVDESTTFLGEARLRVNKRYFDERGRLTKTENALQAPTEMGYAMFSNAVGTVKDALNGVQKEVFDWRGNRVLLVGKRRVPTDPESSTSEVSPKWLFFYDGLGRMKTTHTSVQVNGETVGLNFGIEYVANRDLVGSISEPSGQTTTFNGYDSGGRLLSKTDATGTVNYDYDSAKRLTKVREGTKEIERSYSVLDQVKSVKNSRGERIDFDYLAGTGLVERVWYPVEASVNGVVPPRKSVRYEYDNQQRLEKVWDWAGRLTQYHYDQRGRISKVRLPNGAERLYDFALGGELNEVRDRWVSDGRLIALAKMEYDVGGRPLRRLGVPFDYDKATGFEGEYLLDNRLWKVNGAGTSSDYDGNLTRALDPLYGGEMVLNYNSRNWVIGGTVKGRGASYEYDAEGHRVSATVNGVRTRYVVNPEAALSQVLVREVEGVPSGANGKRCWSVWGHGLIYEVETATGTGGSGVGVEKLRVHHYDQVGNTVVVTDEAQRDVLWVRYDAYGAVTHAESPAQRDGGGPIMADLNGMADKLDRALAVTPYLYGGQQGVMTDGNGLVHMRARYYHPGIRRFVNADPIGFEGGMNWYGYANGDPVMRSDPSGKAVPVIVAGVILYALGEDYMNAPGPGEPTYASGGGTARMVAVTGAATTGTLGAAAMSTGAPAAVNALTTYGFSHTAAQGIVTPVVLGAGAFGGWRTYENTKAAWQADDMDTVALNTITLFSGLSYGANGGGRSMSEGMMRAPSPAPNTWNPIRLAADEISKVYNPFHRGGSIAAWNSSSPTPTSGGAAAAFFASGVGSHNGGCRR